MIIKDKRKLKKHLESLKELQTHYKKFGTLFYKDMLEHSVIPHVEETMRQYEMAISNALILDKEVDTSKELQSIIEKLIRGLLNSLLDKNIPIQLVPLAIYSYLHLLIPAPQEMQVAVKDGDYVSETVLKQIAKEK